MSRLPIRLRLTLGFTAVMAALLAAGGALLWFNLVGGLDATIERSLRARADDVQTLLRRADEGLARSGRSTLTEFGESFAQVLDVRGAVVDATPGLRREPLLTPAQFAKASSGTLIVERVDVVADADSERLLATPVEARGGRFVVVVGEALDERDEAVHNLLVLLAIGGPIALLLAAGVGYGLASAALRPVEAMRQRASLISGGSSGERLPLAQTRDEIHRLGETLNDMLARLDDALLRERAFVSDASHELRTPLAILKSELEIALRRERPADELREAIASAAAETDRVVQLAEDLLVMARLDQGRLPVRTTEVRVVNLLDALGERFAARAAAEDRDLLVHDAPFDLVVPADQLRIEQALGNLIENAFRHGQGTIELSAQTNGSMVELGVHDQGPGVPPGFAARAFDRFARAETARGRAGAGLGLSIVLAIARAHQGDAGLRNDGGTYAWITIPRRAPALT